MQATISSEPGSVASNPLSPEELRKINAYWRAANYLSAGQIYLYDNPLLTEPLRLEHIKPRLLGHWGIGRTERLSWGQSSTAILNKSTRTTTRDELFLKTRNYRPTCPIPRGAARH